MTLAGSAACLARQLASKYQALWCGNACVKRVAPQIETCELLRHRDAVGDDVARHQAACHFSHEADDFVLTVFVLFKHAFNDAGIQGFLIDRLEILLRRQVDDHGAGVVFQALVQVAGDLAAPKTVQVLCFGCLNSNVNWNLSVLFFKE